MSQAAELYGFARDYLRQLCIRGRLECRKLGNFWVTTPADMEEFIRSRQQRGVYRDDIELDS
jgi:hypothetical protein